jgi:hypothetical protein
VSEESNKFFTEEEELDAIKLEQESVFTQVLELLYNLVIEKAKYLIKIQSPSLPIKSKG